jgi:hypothetical protein
MFISTSSEPRIGLVVIPPALYAIAAESDFPLDGFTNLDQLSGILSDADVSYYLWYNSKAKEWVPEVADDLTSLFDEPTFQAWIANHQALYDKVVAECDAKYSIAGGGSRRALAVDYGSGCFYTPTCSSGVLFMTGSAEDPYSGRKSHYYDAVLAELAKAVRVTDLTQFTVFDKYVGAPMVA